MRRKQRSSQRIALVGIFSPLFLLAAIVGSVLVVQNGTRILTFAKTKLKDLPPYAPQNLSAVPPFASDSPEWQMHTIDNSIKGADGTKFADINGDGKQDIVTGWEGAGRTRIYLQPPRSEVGDPWPMIDVGRTPDVEDAVFLDMNNDGVLDVVSSSEGETKKLFVFLAPKDPTQLEDVKAWKKKELPASVSAMQWMFAIPLQIDGKNGIDIVAGGKGPGAKIGWFRSPRSPKNLEQWDWFPLNKAGWIMSIAASDMDGDGDSDIVVSDRRGHVEEEEELQRFALFPGGGSYWLENPGVDGQLTKPWERHAITGGNLNVRFLTLGDIDNDGLVDVLTATKEVGIVISRRSAEDGDHWEEYTVPMPMEAELAKALSVGDVDGDGRGDIVVVTVKAEDKQGVYWLKNTGTFARGQWTAYPISGVRGTKYDLVDLLDIDGDGDLDVVTSEEKEGLGVIWYENPAK